MRVVAGLGNPGSRYSGTRHNAGFRVVDLLAARGGVSGVRAAGSAARARALIGRLLGRPEAAGRLGVRGGSDAWLSEASLGGERVLLLKPLGYMNTSGIPVARALGLAGASPADLVVIVDDVALELGRVRIRTRGRHGGHNGLRSVIAQLGSEDFVRVRIGVRGGALPRDLAEYVLAEVPREELPAFEGALERAAEAVECVVREGPAVAMDRFNAARA